MYNRCLGLLFLTMQFLMGAHCLVSATPEAGSEPDVARASVRRQRPCFALRTTRKTLLCSATPPLGRRQPASARIPTTLCTPHRTGTAVQGRKAPPSVGSLTAVRRSRTRNHSSASASGKLDRSAHPLSAHIKSWPSARWRPHSNARASHMRGSRRSTASSPATKTSTEQDRSQVPSTLQLHLNGTQISRTRPTP